MATKNEIKIKFEEFLVVVHNFINKKLKTIRCDNDVKVLNNEMKEFLCQKTHIFWTTLTFIIMILQFNSEYFVFTIKIYILFLNNNCGLSKSKNNSV